MLHFLSVSPPKSFGGMLPGEYRAVSIGSIPELPGGFERFCGKTGHPQARISFPHQKLTEMHQNLSFPHVVICHPQARISFPHGWI
jgi:hypothetical protein